MQPRLLARLLAPLTRKACSIHLVLQGFYRIRIGVQPLDEAHLFQALPATWHDRPRATHAHTLTLLNPLTSREQQLVYSTHDVIYEHCKREYDSAT